jgi:Tfp pilus assembly protein PilV
MATRIPARLRNPQPASRDPRFVIRKPQPQRGFSFLDLLVVLLVLTLILLAAVKQFKSYQQPPPAPTQPTQAAPSS